MDSHPTGSSSQRVVQRAFRQTEEVVDLPEPVVLLILVVGFVHLDPTVLDALDLTTLTTTTVVVLNPVDLVQDLRRRLHSRLRLRRLRLRRLVLVVLDQSATLSLISLLLSSDLSPYVSRSRCLGLGPRGDPR